MIRLGVAALVLAAVIAGAAIYTWGYRSDEVGAAEVKQYARMFVGVCTAQFGKDCHFVGLDHLAHNMWRVRFGVKGDSRESCALLDAKHFEVLQPPNQSFVLNGVVLVRCPK